MTTHADPVPPDDPARALTVARPDQDEHLPHIGLPDTDSDDHQ